MTRPLNHNRAITLGDHAWFNTRYNRNAQASEIEAMHKARREWVEYTKAQKQKKPVKRVNVLDEI